MTLTDTGALVALIDADEPDHNRCRTTLDSLQLPLLTTWPAFTEAMYLLSRHDRRATQQLWNWVLENELVLADLSRSSAIRASSLMTQYADRPMSLADATLVALAEERELSRIFTLDDDFRVYRLHGRRHFEVVR